MSEHGILGAETDGGLGRGGRDARQDLKFVNKKEIVDE